MKIQVYQTMKKIITLLFVLVLTGTGCSQITDVPEVLIDQNAASKSTEIGIDIGDRAPDFTLKDFDGNEVELSELRGEPVVIDFWAAWCPFCLREIPDIQKIHGEFRDVQILGIHRSETESIEKGKKFIDELGATYSLLSDENGDVYKTYTGGRQLMPVAIFIDSFGIIQERIYGPKSYEQMVMAISKLK
jgi:cytochrome c biogenesis protein CcmG, thiol:disulfide interchange protein DsbE